MNRIVKYAATAAMAGGLALVAAMPSQARHGWNAAAIGLGVGAAVGAAAAGAAYNGGYYYEPGYDYGYAPEYGYAPGYYGYAPGYDAYAYAPAYRSGYGNWGWSQQHSTSNLGVSSQR